MQQNSPLQDQSIRDELQDPGKLGENLLLEASAGTGKTTTLANRAVALVESGTPITEIATITFTKKATAELRHRIRKTLKQKLEALTQSSQPDSQSEKLIKAALLNLDSAAIDTIHGFSKKILDQFPINAGLPHNFEIQNEVQEKVYFMQKWQDYFLKKLEEPASDEEFNLVIRLGQILGIDTKTQGNLYKASQEIDRKINTLPKNLPEWNHFNYDDFDNILNYLDRIHPDLYSHLKENSHKQKAQLDAVGSGLEALKFDINNLSETEKAIRIFEISQNVPTPAIKSEPFQKLLQEFYRERDRAVSNVLQNLLILLIDFSNRCVADRTQAGKITFDDILFFVQKILTHHQKGDEIRSRLSGQYKYILIDEFQDTNPLQYEIAKLIATPPGDKNLKPGSLFLVGDWKQSIYRFRGADVAAFESSRTEASQIRKLTTNFRTIQPICDFINRIFDTSVLLGDHDYSPLIPHRTVPENIDIGPPAAFIEIGTEASPDGASKLSADDMRLHEAEEIAQNILGMLDVNQGWRVYDEQSDEWRPAQLQDICILVPKRTKLNIYTSELEKCHIPYRLESGGFIYEEPEIQNLVSTLKAVSNPEDSLSLIRALRSSLFACSDNDLYNFHRTHSKLKGSTWNYLSEACENCSCPADMVHEAMHWFRAAHKKSSEATAGELLEFITVDRLAAEIAKSNCADSLFFHISSTLDLFAGKVREFESESDGSLNSLLLWIDQEIASQSRYDLPASNNLAPAVKIMTIHAAKGLEFPIVILANLNAEAKSSTGPQVGISSTKETKEIHFGMKKNVSMLSYPSLQKYEEYKEAEKVEESNEMKRLLYVACTRARDHLLLCTSSLASNDTMSSLVWKAMEEGIGSPKESIDERGIFDEYGIGKTRLSDLPEILPDSVIELPRQKSGELPDFQSWQAQREATLQKAKAKGLKSATDIVREARGAEKIYEFGQETDSEDADTDPEEPRQRFHKNKGSDIGNAIHFTFRDLDFSLPPQELQSELEEIISRHSKEQGLGKKDAEKARAACLNILKSPAIVRALELSRSKEGIVKKEIRLQAQLDEAGNQKLDGFVDLLIYDPKTKKYTILDYKYSSRLDDKVLNERMKGYKYQGASYAIALNEILNSDPRSEGKTPNPSQVPEVVFVFASEKEAEERNLENISKIEAEIKELLKI